MLNEDLRFFLFPVEPSSKDAALLDNLQYLEPVFGVMSDGQHLLEVTVPHRVQIGVVVE
jgi:hypothetical protein